MGNVEMSGLMLGAPRSNKEPWTPSKQIAQFTPVTFSKSGQLQYFYRDGLSGKELYAALEKMDRKHQGFASTTDGALSFTLPATWEGTAKGKADGNPVAANGKSVWALYRLWPADAKMAANWTPMVWEGTRWNAPDHTQGGHASATVEGGGVKFGVMGPWGGNEFNYPKTGALAFIAPADGTWRITAKASVKPWDGGAKEFPLAALKKDTQRAAEVQSCKLPRDGTAVTLDFTVALSAGHELLLAPMTEHLHNNAGTVTIESVTVRKE